MISNTNVSTEIQNNQDGEDVSWEKLLDAAFYRGLGWDFQDCWQMPDRKTAPFILPVLKSQKEPALVAGRTPYAPLRLYSVRDFEQLETNPDYHYMLARDLVVPKSYGGWTPLCTSEDGFVGTLDGDGHTISGLQITKHGFFAQLGGGTVRNLHLKDVVIAVGESMGGFAPENHGYLENCSIQGEAVLTQAGDALSVGGIVGQNYNVIENVKSELTVQVTATVATVGGIVGQNEGFIDTALFEGAIHASAEGNANLQLGGIAGINHDGFIYHAYSNAQLRTNAAVGYLGGICGLQTAGEMYKCATKGNVYASAQPDSKSAAYLGGICGMAETGLMMNSFSAMVLSGKAAVAYAGGICGYSGSATIQNTYTTGEISLNSFVIHPEPSVFAGGICGYNASGFVNGSVALCSGIHTNGASGRICAWSAPEQISDVYAYENMACSTKLLPETEMGRSVSKQTVCDIRFFFAPAGDGGKLGWSNTRYDGTEAVWTSDVEGKGNYSLPLLNGVPRQNTFIMPDLK